MAAPTTIADMNDFDDANATNGSLHAAADDGAYGGPGAPRLLRRSLHRRLIAGVCGGLGEFLGVDPNLLRLGLAVFTVFGGAGVLFYLVGWLLIPAEGQDASIAETLIAKVGR